MCPPPSDDDLFDFLLTYQAGLAFAAVDAMLQLEESFLAIGINIVGDRRSTRGDGLFQHLAQRLAKRRQLRARERASAPARANTGATQAFIGVDVSYAVQQSLIEQQSLDGRGAPVKQASESFLADGERLGAGAGEISLADLQP